MGKHNAALDEVRQAELQVIRGRRQRILARLGSNDNPVTGAGDGSLVGLALSGGGIRSAATNLGILQGLAKGGVFQFIDYLSTVSGGGYIGACLASLLSNHLTRKGAEAYNFSPCGPKKEEPALFTTAWENFPFRDDHGAGRHARLTGKEQMTHIRSRASYLTPQAQVFSSSVLKAVGSLTLTTFIPLVWFLTGIVFLVSLYMAFITSAAGQWASAARSQFLIQSQAAGPCDWKCGLIHLKNLMIFPFTLLASGNIWILMTAGVITSILILVAALLLVERPVLIKKRMLPSLAIFGLILLLPSVLFGLAITLEGFSPGSSAIVPVAGLSLLLAWHQSGPGQPEEEPDVITDRRYRDLTLTLAVPAPLAVFLSMRTSAALAGPSVFAGGLFLGSGLVLLVSARLRPFFLPWNRQTRSFLNISAAVFFWTIIVTLSLGFLPGLIMAGKEIGSLTFLGLQAGLAFGLRWWLGQVTTQAREEKPVSRRLPLGFMKVLLPALTGLFILLAIIFAGHLLIRYLVPNWPEGEAKFLWFTGTAAFGLLILLNFLANMNHISPHYFYRDRLAETFLRTIYKKKGQEEAVRDDAEMRLNELHGTCGQGFLNCAGRGPYTLLNASLNISAAHDLKGFNRQAESFTFSRLFIGSKRTGYTPTDTYCRGAIKVARAMTISGAALSPVMGIYGSPAAAFACSVLGIRLGYWLPNPKSPKKRCDPWWWWGLFLSEIRNYTHTRSSYIYLSDGGHCGDNLGILPLLQRRVKMVIAADAECDPEHAFNSLNSSIRQAYVDEGIKIDLDLKNLSLNRKNFSTRHFALGRVLYPDRPWQRSWLLVLKNSLNGDEIAPILNYRKKSRAFPHESTADQWFTEEQFESYRALGRHAAEAAFEAAAPKIEGENLWDRLEELCHRIEGLQQAAGRRDGPARTGRNRPPHQWDDILTALGDTEQGGFENWQDFTEMILSRAAALVEPNNQGDPKRICSENKKKLQELIDAGKRSPSPASDLAEIAVWLSEHNFCFEGNLQARLGRVPREMAAFRSAAWQCPPA